MGFTKSVIEAIEKSAMWKDLNETAKRVSEKDGKVISEQEYAAMREFFIKMVIACDENVKNIACKELYNELKL